MLIFLALWMALTRPPLAFAAVEPAAIEQQVMSTDDIIAFLEKQKKGTPIQLTLSQGKVIKGLFSSYDDYYETVWIVPRGEPGVFSQKGLKVTGIRSIALWDRQAPSAPSVAPGGPGATGRREATVEDYYLLEGEDLKK